MASPGPSESKAEATRHAEDKVSEAPLAQAVARARTLEGSALRGLPFCQAPGQPCLYQAVKSGASGCGPSGGTAGVVAPTEKVGVLRITTTELRWMQQRLPEVQRMAAALVRWQSGACVMVHEQIVSAAGQLPLVARFFVQSWCALAKDLTVALDTRVLCAAYGPVVNSVPGVQGPGTSVLCCRDLLARVHRAVPSVLPLFMALNVSACTCSPLFAGLVTSAMILRMLADGRDGEADVYRYRLALRLADQLQLPEGEPRFVPMPLLVRSSSV